MTINQAINKENLIKITGTLTSPVQLRGENSKDPYYYSFIRCKGQSVDLPVIFKDKPPLKKNDEIELLGNYSNSPHSIRKSFTAYSYQLLTEDRETESITLTGLTTSEVEQTASYPPYVFLKLDCADNQKPCECSSLPVFFKIKEKPTIKKGSYLQVKGHFDNPLDGKKSFTAYSYQILDHDR